MILVTNVVVDQSKLNVRIYQYFNMMIQRFSNNLDKICVQWSISVSISHIANVPSIRLFLFSLHPQDFCYIFAIYVLFPIKFMYPVYKIQLLAPQRGDAHRKGAFRDPYVNAVTFLIPIL